MVETKPIPAATLRGDKIVTDEDAIRAVGIETFTRLDKAANRQATLSSRIMNFVKGENKLGRKLGLITDLAMFFLPSGVRSGREAVQRIITKEEKRMSIVKDKPDHKSTSIWGVAIFVVTALLQTFGVELVNDPAFMESIYHVIYVLSGALGFTGLRRAIGRKSDKIEGNPAES